MSLAKELAIIKQLKTLQHPEIEFTEPFLDFIFGRTKHLSCSHFHPKMTCW